VLSGNIPNERLFRGRLARNTLLILLLLTLAPLFLLGSTAYVRTRQLLREQVFSLLTTVSTVQGNRIVDEITAGRQLLVRALADADVIEPMHTALALTDRNQAEYVSARNQFFDQLQTVNQPKPFFNQFVVINPEGIIHISTNRQWEGQRITSTSGFSPQTRQASSRAVTKFQPLYEQSLVIVTTIPYLNSEGNQVATILGISEPAVLSALMQRIAFFTDAHYFVSSDRKFFGVNPYPDSFEKMILFEPNDDLNLFVEYANGQPLKNGVNELLSFQNRPVIAAYNWLPDLQIGWLAEIPQASVYQQLNTLVVFATILFLVTALILLFTVWQATRYLVRPLTQLAASVTKFSAGNWDERAAVKRDDEVGLLADSFNKMAADLSILYQSLETKVEERTRQLQASGEIGQVTITATDLDELLHQTVTLLANRFGYPFAAIYLLDEGSEFAILRQVTAPAEMEPRLRGMRIKVEPLSLVGWVAMTGSSKVDLIGQGAFGAIERMDLAPDVRAEAGIPILHAGKVLGILVVQSNRPTHLNEDTIQELQNLANQISPALQNFYLLEATQINLQETNLLYQVSHQIAQAPTETEIYKLAEQALRNTPYNSAFLVVNGTQFDQIWSNTKADQASLPASSIIDPQRLNHLLPSSGALIYQLNQKQTDVPADLVEWFRKFRHSTLAMLPVRRSGRLHGLLLLGTNEEDARAGLRFSHLHLQPYSNLIELMTNSLEKVRALDITQKRLNEMEILNNLSREVAQQTNLESLYNIIHQHIKEIFGEVDFLLALLDIEKRQIRVPYAFEEGQRLQVPSIPFGQGLTSLVISSRKPLRLGSPDDWSALPAGSTVIYGKKAFSWLGVPMIVAGEVVGVMTVQDVHESRRFSLEDEHFFSTLATQVAVIIRNTTLLETTRQRADAESMLNQITSNIRRSMSIPEILATTTTELSHALQVRKAKIVIRPAQSDAHGIQAPENGGENGNKPAVKSLPGESREVEHGT